MILNLVVELKNYHLPEEESGSRFSTCSRVRAFDEAGTVTGPFGIGYFIKESYQFEVLSGGPVLSCS